MTIVIYIREINIIAIEMIMVVAIIVAIMTVGSTKGGTMLISIIAVETTKTMVMGIQDRDKTLPIEVETIEDEMKHRLIEARENEETTAITKTTR